LLNSLLSHPKCTTNMLLQAGVCSLYLSFHAFILLQNTSDVFVLSTNYLISSISEVDYFTATPVTINLELHRPQAARTGVAVKYLTITAYWNMKFTHILFIGFT